MQGIDDFGYVQNRIERGNKVPFEVRAKKHSLIMYIWFWFTDYRFNRFNYNKIYLYQIFTKYLSYILLLNLYEISTIYLYQIFTKYLHIYLYQIFTKYLPYISLSNLYEIFTVYISIKSLRNIYNIYLYQIFYYK